YHQQPLAGACVLRNRAAQKLPTAYQFPSPWSDECRIRLMRRHRALANPDALKLTPQEKIQIALRKAIEQRVVQRANCVLVLSKYMGSLCRSLHHIAEDRVTVVPGGVDTNHFHDRADRMSLRAKLNLPGDSPVLL